MTGGSAGCSLCMAFSGLLSMVFCIAGSSSSLNSEWERWRSTELHLFSVCCWGLVLLMSTVFMYSSSTALWWKQHHQSDASTYPSDVPKAEFQMCTDSGNVCFIGKCITFGYNIIIVIPKNYKGRKYLIENVPSLIQIAFLQHNTTFRLNHAQYQNIT